MPFVKIHSNCLSTKFIEWTERHFREFDQCTKRLTDISKKAGKTSDAFQKTVKNFQFLSTWKTLEDINREIIKPIHVRAVTHLLLTSDKFRKKVPISQRLLTTLEKPLGRLTNLTLLSLVRLWFEHFDKLCSPDVLKVFGKFLSERIESRVAKHNCSPEMKNLHEYAELIFKSDGPARLINSLSQSEALDEIFNKPGLQGYESGRFQNICRMLYYIETLSRIPVGTNHSVLAEVKKREVYEAPFDDKLLIGHRILSILIDRSPEEDVSDCWQDVILAIAGDPRVPKASPKYQKWWAFLTQQQISKVYGWLSKVDLQLFLAALEEHGKSSGNFDLQRMFPSRKKFLEGLIKQGLVKRSRLFIGSKADMFLKQIYKNKELPSYARALDTYRSMIYLQVGNCHFIEGSHSFKLWIFSKIPEDSKIFNYTKREFTVWELSTSLVSDCLKIYKSEFKYTDIVHSPLNFRWQHKAIEFLKENGEVLDLEDIFTTQEYRSYKIMYGF